MVLFVLFLIQVTLLEVDSKIQVRPFTYVIAKIIVHLLIGCSHSVQWLGLDHPKWKWVFFWFWFCRERVWNRSGLHFKSFLYGYRSRHQRSFWLNWYNKGNVFRMRHSVSLCYFAKKRKERCNWRWSSYLNNKAFASLNRQD